MAVAVALETVAAQGDQPKVHSGGSSVEVPESLKPFIVYRSENQDTISVPAAAERLGVSHSTVYNWVNNGKLLAWKPAGRRLVIPARQILGPRRVVPGIAEVFDIIDDPELTWAFLSEEWPFADDVACPIDKLVAGLVDEVVDAAPAFGTTFT